ncbi:MAG: hypothetical protein IGR76_13070 [Synechococcales cyanobacterium T60_A2020_003]|nr:hypothetical protein [Synechococcales cyanobacterium T60_A2020_003]
MPRLILFPGLSILALSLPLWAIAPFCTPKPLAQSNPATLQAVPLSMSLTPSNPYQAQQIAVVWE